MGKVRYEIDPHNRLVIDEAGRKSGLPVFRKVIDGCFKTDENNSLTYHVKVPVSRDSDIPHQVKLKGKWSLSEDHTLRLTLDKWGRQTFGDKVTLKGDIIDVDKNSLLFAITTKTKENTQSTYILTLRGAWQADEDNRLTFRVKKEQGRCDILIFNGAWEINKDHRIVYQYEKADLIRKRKRVHTLIFKGHWDIKDKFRISYVIDRNTDSVFNFRTSAGIFRERYVKYEIGIGLKRKTAPVTQTITLFGKWKIKKGVGLTFEVEYEDKKVRSLVFGADARLTSKDTISFRLRNELNKDIGASVKLSHRILKGGEAFVRALKSKRESAVYAGAAWRR